MPVTKEAIQAFVSDQVSNGSALSYEQAEKETAARLVEMDIDQRIEAGRQQIKEGRFTVVNRETTNALVADIEQAIKASF